MRPALRWLVGAGVIAAATVLSLRQLRTVTWAALAAAWRDTPAADIFLSLACVAASFACLGAYEVFAARRAARDQVPARAAFAIGLVAHALSNTLGFHLLTGTAFRVRAYRRYALARGQVAGLLARVAACVGLGVAGVAAIAMSASIARGSLPAWIGLGACVAGAAFVVGSRWRSPALLRMGQLARQLGPMAPVALVEMLAMVAACWFLWPAALRPDAAHFAMLFIAAMLAGIAAHAPGGIGVFEAAMLTAAPAGQASALLAALLLFRALYNLLPFALAVLVAPSLLAGRSARAGAAAQLEGG